MPIDWTPPLLEELRQAIEARKTASQAAWDFSIKVSRNSLISAARRKLNLVFKSSKRTNSSKASRPRRFSYFKSEAEQKAVGNKRMDEIAAVAVAPPPPAAKLFLELQDGECKWPVSGEKLTMYCCAAQRAHSRTPYCEKHSREGGRGYSGM